MSLTDPMDAIPASAARPEGCHDGLTSRASAADACADPTCHRPASRAQGHERGHRRRDRARQDAGAMEASCRGSQPGQPSKLWPPPAAHLDRGKSTV